MSAIKFKLETPGGEKKDLEFKLDSEDNKTLLDGLLEFQKEINSTLTFFVDKEKKLKEASGKKADAKKHEDAAEEDNDDEEGENDAEESLKNDKIIDEIKNQSKSKRLKGSE